RELHDHTQRLNHAARPHVTQGGERLTGLRLRRKPVAGRQANPDLCQRKGEDRDGKAAAQNRTPGTVTEGSRPSLPPGRRVNAREWPGEPLRPVDVTTERGQRGGQK